jgi:hypothetical protein
MAEKNVTGREGCKGEQDDSRDRLPELRPGWYKSNGCASCGAPATEFNDAVSSVEYLLSGLCQRCQDEVFCPKAEE